MNNSFLGTGWAFPPTFKKNNGALTAANAEDVRQSLWILLTTQLDERVMRLDFGTDLNRLQFEPLTVNLQTYIKDRIRQAVLLHESRVKLESVYLHEDRIIEGIVLIELKYTLVTTNTRDNFVYPFYINEATNLEQ